MLKWLLYPLLFIGSVILQTTLSKWIQFFGAKPDFIIIFVVFAALRKGPAAGAVWGFIAGFSQDVYAPIEWFGAHTISMTILGYIVGFLEERILTLNLALKVVVLGFGFLVSDYIYFLSANFENDTIRMLFFRQTIPDCLYTMLLAVLIFRFLYRSDFKKSQGTTFH